MMLASMQAGEAARPSPGRRLIGFLPALPRRCIQRSHRQQHAQTPDPGLSALGTETKDPASGAGGRRLAPAEEQETDGENGQVRLMTAAYITAPKRADRPPVGRVRPRFRASRRVKDDRRAGAHPTLFHIDAVREDVPPCAPFEQPLAGRYWPASGLCRLCSTTIAIF